MSETPLRATERFNGLDAARAAAMLLGVFYHLPIAFMGGFMGAPPSPKSAIDGWLHSFRMPLFFLISGFFARMMLSKYGWRKYLLRRWQRIGAALFVSLALLALYRDAAERWRAASPPPAFGPFPGMGQPFPGGPLGPGAFPAGAGFPTGPMNRPALPTTGAAGAPPSGAVPPGTQTPGARGAAPTFPGFPGPGSTGRDASAPAASGGTPPGMGFGWPPGGGFGPPGGGPPPATFPVSMPGMPSRAWATRLFGPFSRHVALEHLWFLWYLLVMLTVAPAVTVLIRGTVGRIVGIDSWHAGLGGLLRWNLAGFLLALVTLPALVHARGWMGWTLANPHGFLGTFPDVLFQYTPDWPFYSLYFLAGWWLYLARQHLASLERHWAWAFVFGVTAHALSQSLAARYAPQTSLPAYDWIRWGTFGLFGLGSAYSALGFLGVFQRYFQHPSAAVRYLADTALWVYLIHLPLIPYVIGWVEPSRSAWWVSTAGGMLLVTGVSLALYELIVRPTPLVWLYGPPSPRRHPVSTPPGEHPIKPGPGNA